MTKANTSHNEEVEKHIATPSEGGTDTTETTTATACTSEEPGNLEDKGLQEKDKESSHNQKQQDGTLGAVQDAAAQRVLVITKMEQIDQDSRLPVAGKIRARISNHHHHHGASAEAGQLEEDSGLATEQTNHPTIPLEDEGPGAYSVAGNRNAPEANNVDETRRMTNDEDVEGAPATHHHALSAELVLEDSDATGDSRTPQPTTTTTSPVQIELMWNTSLIVHGQRYQGGEEHGERVSKRFLVGSLLGITVLVAVIALLSLGLSGAFDGGDEGPPPPHQGQPLPTESLSEPTKSTTPSTLDTVRERGVLRAALPIIGWDAANLATTEGQEHDLVRAVAAGIFGEAKVDFVPTPLRELFPSLANGTVDIMITSITHTMERDVLLPYSFSVPFAFGGIRAAGLPFYMNHCVQNAFKHVEECRELKVCVSVNTTHVDVMRQHLPMRHLVPVSSDSTVGGVYGGLIRGDCNVIVEKRYYLSEGFVRSQSWNGTSYTGEYTIGDSYYSRDPLSALTRKDDPEFSDFVNAILLGLMGAELQNISKDMSHLMPQTMVFGEDYKDMFRSAVAVGGNFGEIYDYHFADTLPRDTLDSINNGETGLLYPHPFGSISSAQSDIQVDTMTSIQQRGKIRCGVVSKRQGFAVKLEGGFTTVDGDAQLEDVYSGMDVDYCRALAAGLFQGNSNALELIELESESDGYALLVSKEIDVLAGATWTLENDVKEPTTGKGFSFTSPYFYGYDQEHDNFCMATRQDDPDWSRVVYWIVMGTFYAEDQGIGLLTSNDMPEVRVFGPSLHRMFRDSILAVGSYAEIYKRHVEVFIPRTGRNLLNDNNHPGPQHYVIPGIIV